MDTSRHNLETLFEQLGLSNHPESMDAFISNNHLPKEIPLEQAAFWSAGQAQFIHEAIEQDSDWAEAVDQLDAQLRH
ncbi:DUF2789 domain-containing protein [Oceanicoccus sp. KOV_DT_Chl]|uniref:DUF2789 domain-containing protein n=1 Tax=Oceanicoccus sp. KOV_DT_Chl TaxID=1904639 RepID=UPI000C7BB19A|nr:DUF2789 domain-containing protein [Oceanicoccus sp. KOV_DT_Chl]